MDGRVFDKTSILLYLTQLSVVAIPEIYSEIVTGQKLLEFYHQKIKSKIAEVWGE